MQVRDSPGFETQGSYYQKSKNRGISGSTKRTYVLQKLKNNTLVNGARETEVEEIDEVEIYWCLFRMEAPIQYAFNVDKIFVIQYNFVRRSISQEILLLLEITIGISLFSTLKRKFNKQSKRI